MQERISWIDVENFDRCNPAVAVLARDQPLRDHVAQSLGQTGRGLKACSERLEQTLTKRSTVLTVSTGTETGEHQVAVSAASSMISRVSRSRISLTRMTRGACRKAARRARIKLGGVAVQLSLVDGRPFVVVQKLYRIFDGDDVAGLLFVDAGLAKPPDVDDFPEARGPVTSTMPSRSAPISARCAGNFSEARLGIALGITRMTDGATAALNEYVGAKSCYARDAIRDIAETLFAKSSRPPVCCCR